MMERRPIIVVGSGPAGSGTFLHLQQLDPVLAGETLVLEKAQHPRRKVCAGGLIPHAVRCLRALDIELTVPYVTVHSAAVTTPRCRVTHADHNLCYVIRRDEFDAFLVDTCRARGVDLHEEESLLDVCREANGLRVVTNRGEYLTRLLVAADGSGSLVRRRLVGEVKGRVARAVMCDVPVNGTRWDGFSAQRYDFDFREVNSGLRGYRWAFPCLINGVPHVNIGIYALTGRGRVFDDALRAYLDELHAGRPRRQAFPIHWYRPGAPLAAERLFLTGDAAGADPLMGEGISLALEYGAFAARAACAAFCDGDFRGSRYQKSVEESWFGQKLRRLDLAARWFYGTPGRACFFLAEHSARLRAIGLRWYNGVDGWDRRSGWEALAAVLRKDFVAGPGSPRPGADE